jgi:hypothetical protein
VISINCTALALRLTKPFFSSNRHVVGDSAFASVATAIALRKRGLHFSGIVKTASRSFPKKRVRSDLEGTPRGSSVFFTSTVDGVHLMASGWKDKTIKGLISSHGTSCEGTKHKKRSRLGLNGDIEKYTAEINRPAIFESYFKGAVAIDVHDHY